MNFRKLLRKRIIIPTVIILLVVGGVFYNRQKSKNDISNILTDTVKRLDLRQTILATGQVTSATDLNLSFKVSGVVTKINVKVGDKVKNAQVLAILDQKDVAAALTSAQGVLAQARANYQKIIDGASSEEIAVSERAVDAAKVTLANAQKNLEDTKSQQQVLVDNARKKLLNTGLDAVPSTSNINTSNPTIGGTYTGTAEGSYTVRQIGTSYDYIGLESGGPNYISAVAPTPLGSNGLYIQFPSGYTSTYDSWTVDIPNKNSSDYLTNYNAYLSALETQKISVASAEATLNTAAATLDQRTADLNLKKAQARPAELQAAQAAILQAQGQVQTAQASFENTILKSPSEGTITSVDIKVGELAQALKEIMVLQDVVDLHLEANISEANIANIKAEQSVEVTFDALGSELVYQATVQFVNPASTVVSGVVNYKVTAKISETPEIKPGMTANMTILTAQKEKVLAVPQRAILNKDSKKYVRVVTDAKTKTYEEKEITIGLFADEGLAEVLNGLVEGQEIVTFINKK